MAISLSSLGSLIYQFSIFSAQVSDNISSINLCWKSHFYSKNLFMFPYNFLKDMPLGCNTSSLYSSEIWIFLPNFSNIYWAFSDSFVHRTWQYFPMGKEKYHPFHQKEPKLEFTFRLLAVDLIFYVNSVLWLLFSIISWIRITTGSPSPEISFNE